MHLLKSCGVGALLVYSAPMRMLGAGQATLTDARGHAVLICTCAHGSTAGQRKGLNGSGFSVHWHLYMYIRNIHALACLCSTLQCLWLLYSSPLRTRSCSCLLNHVNVLVCGAGAAHLPVQGAAHGQEAAVDGERHCPGHDGARPGRSRGRVRAGAGPTVGW